MSKLIGLLGDYPGVGKDTAADYLVRYHGFTRLSFADLLYQEISVAYGVTVEELARRDLKETPQARFALSQCRERAFVALLLEIEPGLTLRTPLSPRFVLRKWGTEYRRNEDEDYWARPVFARMDREPGNYALTDPRFENELYGSADRGGIFVRIDRPEVAPAVLSDHPSEVFARRWKEDYRLRNDSSLADLYGRLAKMAGVLLLERTA